MFAYSTYFDSTDLALVRKNLTHPRFTIVDDEEDAQVIWSTRHLKNFDKYITDEHVQIMNQFPNEKILTCKDLLYEMCKLYVKWLDNGSSIH